MHKLSDYNRLFLAIFHLILGVLLLSGVISKLYSVGIVFIALVYIVKNKNKNNEAILWSAYMVGAEVLFRMSGGMVFYELPKYSIFIFLLVGLYIENKRHHIAVSYLIYILLLLIGIAFVDIPFNESIRKAIAFNLSGPILLGVSAIYFYNRKIDIEQVLGLLFYMVLPIISMLSLLYFKTPDIKEIAFGGSASFEASGGYGPNQVATILGFGAFVFSIYLFFRKRIFLVLIVDIFFFMYMVFRGLITFSRGGVITAILAIAAFVFFYILGSNHKTQNILKYTGLILISGITLWLYTSNITGGMLVNRYENKNAAGIEKDDVTSGRIDIFMTELDGFFENPFFGLGVGGGKYYRMEETGIDAASHNEVSRLLGEHGMLGVIILMILGIIPLKHMFKQPLLARGFLSAFYLFWFLTINHSAMRIAFPAFIYGLSLIVITKNEEENTVHR